MLKPARTLVIALIGALAVGTAAAGPLEDADAAKKRDDYATAIPIYRSLAEKGNVVAQSFYRSGSGVTEDCLEAARWYGKAAEAGDKEAIGSLTFVGRNWRFMHRDHMNPLVCELAEEFAKKRNATAQM